MCHNYRSLSSLELVLCNKRSDLHKYSTTREKPQLATSRKKPAQQHSAQPKINKLYIYIKTHIYILYIYTYIYYINKTLAPPFISCVTLGCVLKFSVPQLSWLKKARKVLCASALLAEKGHVSLRSQQVSTLAEHLKFHLGNF